jgi:hypothetical protein
LGAGTFEKCEEGMKRLTVSASHDIIVLRDQQRASG